jgi:PilZ domain
MMLALARREVGRRLPIRFRILTGFQAGVHRAVKLLAFNDRMTERRAIARQRVFKAGTIEFDGAGVDCTIRNMSIAGAALDVTTPVGIPHEVILNIPTGQVRQPCHIVWRKENRIGVAFD